MKSKKHVDRVFSWISPWNISSQFTFCSQSFRLTTFWVKKWVCAFDTFRFEFLLQDVLVDKIQQLTSLSYKTPVIRLNNERFKTLVKSAPRNYSVVVMFTALSPQRQCSICQWEIFSSSKRTNRLFSSQFQTGSWWFCCFGRKLSIFRNVFEQTFLRNGRFRRRSRNFSTSELFSTIFFRKRKLSPSFVSRWNWILLLFSFIFRPKKNRKKPINTTFLGTKIDRWNSKIFFFSVGESLLNIWRPGSKIELKLK